MQADELKEREAFEKWRRRTANIGPDSAVALDGFGDDADYAHRATRAMWIGWKGRARLERDALSADVKDRVQKMKQETKP